MRAAAAAAVALMTAPVPALAQSYPWAMNVLKVCYDRRPPERYTEHWTRSMSYWECRSMLVSQERDYKPPQDCIGHFFARCVPTGEEYGGWRGLGWQQKAGSP